MSPSNYNEASNSCNPAAVHKPGYETVSSSADGAGSPSLQLVGLPQTSNTSFQQPSSLVNGEKMPVNILEDETTDRANSTTLPDNMMTVQIVQENMNTEQQPITSVLID